MSTSPESFTIQVLLLAGGKSTRLGSPKHLLQTPSGERLHERQTRLLRAALPGAPIHVSLARESVLDESLCKLPLCRNRHEHEAPLSVLLDKEVNLDEESAGPASGLLAAHCHDPTATWLVAACDYPLLTVEGIRGLLDAPGSPPAVCYRSPEGFCEPLLGVWRPEALRILAEAAAAGQLSPSSAIRAAGGLVLDAPAGSEEWFANVNTPADWGRIRDRCSPPA